MTNYPNAAGHRNVDTSIAASEALNPQLGRLQGVALAAIREAGARGMTTEELAKHLHLDRSSIQPRTSELKRLGRIKDSGNRRLNETGKQAIVWVVR